MSNTPIAIVGAGPYGLSLAAHLHERGIPFRIFGQPMQVWRTQMPAGMHLKSDGFASDLYDPGRRFTLKQYCRDHGIAYADYGLPVSVDTFVAYGLEFQKRLVPTLEPVSVVNISKDQNGYRLGLENGETASAAAVVIATGISYYGYVPDPLAALPTDLCTHSSAHHDLSRFRGRRVVVVGAGASATDVAALLHAAGASVQIVSRRPLEFHLPPGNQPRSLWQRIRAPNLGLGPGLKSALYTAAPGLFQLLPLRMRQRIVREHLGPAGGWFIKDTITRNVQMHVGYSIRATTATPGGISLHLEGISKPSLDIEADHIIAATGYQASVARLSLLSEQLRSMLALEGQSPVLSPSFESSLPGLYFIGVAAALSFGPLMRFARGAEYSAVRLGRHLSSAYGRRSNPSSNRMARA
ncbi:MAG: NAD(P)-binding domain-containing protein [Pseudomonadota bacterium]|nr:NAD(P)-binding domain-containing protein [Pseudomonadota bacterium]